MDHASVPFGEMLLSKLVLFVVDTPSISQESSCASISVQMIIEIRFRISGSEMLLLRLLEIMRRLE